MMRQAIGCKPYQEVNLGRSAQAAGPSFDLVYAAHGCAADEVIV
jgi:hypothetical protein